MGEREGGSPKHPLMVHPLYHNHLLPFHTHKLKIKNEKLENKKEVRAYRQTNRWIERQTERQRKFEVISKNVLVKLLFGNA